MKKNWFLFFALLFLLGFSPVFAFEAKIVGTPTSLWLKPQKVTPTTTCGVKLGDDNASWIDFWKDCWEDTDSRRNNAERDRQARHDRIEPQRHEGSGANFHPRVNFQDDRNPRSASFEGVKYKKYYETFIVRKVSDLLDNVHVPFQILRGSSSRDNWFVKWQGDPFSYSTGNSQTYNRDAYGLVSINWGENRLTKPGVHIYWGWGNKLLNAFNAAFKYRIGPKYSPASDRSNKSAVMNNDDIYEIISISQNWGLTSDQRAQVASYLAIKYGIPLRHNYFAGNGTQVYDLSSYGNQVFGLGKDIDTTSLDQRIAKSLEDDDLIISTDDNFTKLNDQHKPLEKNEAYLLLWNNAKTYTQTTTDGLEKSDNEQYFTMRSQKIWKIQNTDFEQKVNLQFGSAFTGLVGADDKYVLLVSSGDGKFSELESIKWTGELIDGKLVFKDVELPEGTNYMTVAIRDLTPSQWISLSYDLQWGVLSSPNPDSLLSWTLLSILSQPSRSWFHFSGWNYTGDAILADNASLTKSGTLYANWTKDPDQRVKLTFDVKWGTTLSEQEVLKNAELLSGDLPTTTKSGYLFRGWSLDGATVLSYPRSFDQNITLSAVWEKDPDQWIELQFETLDGTAVTGTSFLLWTLASELPKSQKSWFTFGGWNYNTGDAILADNASLTTSGTLYANWTKDPDQRVKLTFDVKWGTTLSEQEVLKNAELLSGDLPTTTKSGYLFRGWSLDGATVLSYPRSFDQNITLSAVWEKDPIPSIVPTHGYSGGGGFISHSASQNSTPSSQETIKNTELSKEEKEQQTAYERAYENKITTLYPQTEARLFEPITRAELAKMMSVYTTKFLKKIPISWKLGCSDFQDKDQTSPELAGFMQTACELEIMGLHSDGKTPLSLFRPNDLVSRAEFATVLSRMKRGNQYDNNQPEWRWEDHLKNLHEKMIITIPDPNIIELRGRILLMLHRMER